MPLTLIQLISEQTMQNLLPILRLRPAKLVHFVTPRTAGTSDQLRRGVQAAGLDPDIEVVQLSGMPGIPESFNAVKHALEQAMHTGHEPVVNFTGGTKLLSIGAYGAAQALKAPSLYVDSQDACFVDGATSPLMAELLENDWSFTPIRKQLRVDVLGIANGVARITAGKPWEPMLPLAEHLFAHPAEEQATHEAIHGSAGLYPGGYEPRKVEEWLAAFDRPIALPEPVVPLAVKAGLVRREASSGQVHLPDQARKAMKKLQGKEFSEVRSQYYKVVAPLQLASAFLSGAWWEVIVCDAAQRSGLFRDLRWSAQVGSKNGADTEEDLLGLDGVELLYVSCKRGGAKARLVPLLDELRNRAQTIGGSFNRRFLAVYKAPDRRTASNLAQRTKALGVRLVTAENVYDKGTFSR